MSDVEATTLIRTNWGRCVNNGSGRTLMGPDVSSTPLGLPAARSLAQHLKTTLIFLLVDLATREPIG